MPRPRKCKQINKTSKEQDGDCERRQKEKKVIGDGRRRNKKRVKQAKKIKNLPSSI